MAKQKRETVREMIYWSYANLAMAHSAISKGQNKYGMVNYMVRAKLFKGLKDGTMNMKSIFDDEKVKLSTGKICNYCGESQNLALDHIFPKKYGGLDVAENLIFACKSCNSSKGKKDMIEWMLSTNRFFPLMIIRRYLKLTFYHCTEHNLLDKKIENVLELELPFLIELLPTSFPKPSELVLSIENIPLT